MWSSDSENNHQWQHFVRQCINFNFVSLFEYNEHFRFGLSAIAVEKLLHDIGHILHYPTHRSNALSARNQLLTALHWLGNGACMAFLNLQFVEQCILWS
jgi:hypothetical protein